MDPDAIIGIDLGTTNSEVAIITGSRPEVVPDGQDFILPSCVGLDLDGNIIVGQQARNQFVAAPERTVLSIKRQMGKTSRVSLGDRNYTPQEISAFILKELKQRASNTLGHDVSKAVITVPAYFTDSQRQATREAGQIAGLEVVRIINEPTAAALTYESGQSGEHKILVYDLGGGTFDVSVVAIEDGVVEVLATMGDNELGGNDFDEIIVGLLNDFIESDLGLKDCRSDILLQARLTRAAEQAKIALSEQPYVRIEEDHIGSEGGKDVHLSFELSRATFEEAVDGMLARTMTAVTKALSDARLRPDQLERVLLVGGSTRIPRVASLLRERLGHEPHGEVDPDLCVALGAGVQAGIEMGKDMQAVLVDITPYTFGTRVSGERNGFWSEDIFIPIIRRNSKLPVARTEAFYTFTSAQKMASIDVYQGEHEKASNNVKIANFLFEGLNESEDAFDAGILFSYSLDLDGILHIHALERATGKELRATIDGVMDRLSDDDVASSKARIGSDWDDNVSESEIVDATSDITAPAAPIDDDEEIAAVLKRAEQALALAYGEDRTEMVDLMEDLRNALKQCDEEKVKGLGKALDELLFYLE